MKRSEINQAYHQANRCFFQHAWKLPPNAHWDITDFGLGDFSHEGLTLVNLASEPEYCEKLMYAAKRQRTPCHAHAKKKEDIICRNGTLLIWLWSRRPLDEQSGEAQPVKVSINGRSAAIPAGQPYSLNAGYRVTLVPGIWHAFAPATDHCIIGEVSTANDDLHDNFFINPDIGRFPGIVEDEPAAIRLVSE